MYINFNAKTRARSTNFVQRKIAKATKKNKTILTKQPVNSIQLSQIDSFFLMQRVFQNFS